MAGKSLIVGLGNPGEEYAETRHNIGFLVLDAVAAATGAHFESEGPAARRFRLFPVASRVNDTAWASHRGRSFGLLKPLAFMNRSGGPVRKFLGKHQIDPRDVLIIHDDINLPLGAVRIRPSGSAGGHNGLQDIIDALNSTNLPRMRIGIGDNFARGKQSDYVLSPFDPAEQPIVEETIRFACEAALTFVREGMGAAMNRFNRKQSPLLDS